MERILRYLNNYFFRFKETGVFKIIDGKLTGTKGKYLEGQYLLLEGSYFNDGIVQVLNAGEQEITITSLYSEEFEGVVYSLAIPRQILDLVSKIELWEKENKITNIQSESFGNYSYSNKSNKNGDAFSWQDAYANELKPYRKMYSGKEKVKEL